MDPGSGTVLIGEKWSDAEDGTFRAGAAHAFSLALVTANTTALANGTGTGHANGTAGPAVALAFVTCVERVVFDVVTDAGLALEATMFAAGSGYTGVLTSDAPPAVGCGAVSPNPYRVTVTATLGSESHTCTANLSVMDSSPPVADCRGDTITVALDPRAPNGATAVPPAMLDGGTSGDNCGFELAVDSPPLTCADVGAGPTPLRLVATDAGGTTASCLVSAVAVDMAPPYFPSCDQGATVALNASGGADLTGIGAAAAAAVGDNCGVVGGAIRSGPLEATCVDVGTTLAVVHSAIDGQGNAANCTTQVHVVDATPPVALCVTDVVTFPLSDHDPSAELPVALIDRGSHDNCGTVSVELNVTAFGCEHVTSPHTVVGLTATDAAGHTTTCSTPPVMVVDVTPPDLVCRDATVRPIGDSQWEIDPVAEVVERASDNCRLDSDGLAVTPAVGLVSCATSDEFELTGTAADQEQGGRGARVSACGKTFDAPPPCCLNSPRPCLSLAFPFLFSHRGATVTATDFSGNTATCTARLTVSGDCSVGGGGGGGGGLQSGEYLFGASSAGRGVATLFGILVGTILVLCTAGYCVFVCVARARTPPDEATKAPSADPETAHPSRPSQPASAFTTLSSLSSSSSPSSSSTSTTSTTSRCTLTLSKAPAVGGGASVGTPTTSSSTTSTSDTSTTSASSVSSLSASSSHPLIALVSVDNSGQAGRGQRIR